MVGPVRGCLERNTWVCGEYLTTRADDLARATVQHVTLTVVSVVLGLVIAMPLALAARRYASLTGAVLATTTLIYTIPSLAMFALLLPFTGLSPATVVVGLTLYSLTILVRNILAGLDGVPSGVREAALGMGYGPVRLLARVELPLALPSIMAGLRIATVSTVAMATVGAVVGSGGLGNLVYAGLQTTFKAEVLAASVLCVALALAADLLLLGLQRGLTPWARSPR